MVTDAQIGVAIEAFDQKAGYSKIEKMRAALEAALSASEPQPAPSVAVKALEWRPGSHGRKTASVFGRLMYEVGTDKGKWYWLHNWEGLAIRYVGSEDEALLAATTDYEARIRSALSAQVQDVAESKPLELNVTKEWFEKRAALEGDLEIGAGRRKLTACIDPTPDELAELYRIAHRIPEGWQLVPTEPTKEMCEAAPSLPSIHAVDDLPLNKAGWSMKAIQNLKRYRAMLAVAPAKQEG